VAEWRGRVLALPETADFFGLPGIPPYYYGVGGMKQLPYKLLQHAQELAKVRVFSGQRVAEMTKDQNGKWQVYGVEGAAAFHDTPEAEAKTAEHRALGSAAGGEGYDVVVMTDVSSSFAAWHRASAGVPEEFAANVRQTVGSRVSLFSAMVAFAQPIGAALDILVVEDESPLWFAARTGSKEGCAHEGPECWTLVSSPSYALEEIRLTPMQTEDGEFIPQPPDYLRDVPAKDLHVAFMSLLVKKGLLAEGDVPEPIYMDAQRWGSAMPAHRHLSSTSPTKTVLCGVDYDATKGSLAPTPIQGSTEGNFVADDTAGLYQCGDMVARACAPGCEGAILSALELADHLLRSRSHAL
jgi:protoporphyrinogen oxidase